MARIRLLPATIATALLLMSVKTADVIHGMSALSNRLFPPVEAEQSGGEAPKPADASAGKKPDAGDAAKKDDKKSADAKDAGKKDGGKEEKKDEGAANCEKPEKPKNPHVSDSAGDTVNHRYTAVEVELLQNLAKRREDLDHWADNVQIKEAALDATEKRVDNKIGQIEAMKKEVSALLAQYNEKEDAKIRSLVKIYENMKPGDAARIFDEVDMPILLLVIDKMSEKKAAPILAQMKPEIAERITVELARQRQLDASKFAIPPAPASAPAAPPAKATP